MIVRVASFNVLAVAYLDHGTYTPEALALLRSDGRIPRLLQYIDSVGADVIGLQEVERPLVVALRETGEWQVYWTAKRRNMPDGCVLLVRKGIDAKSFDVMAYPDGTGHVLQSLRIGGVLFVNTHIIWSPEDATPHFGAGQMYEVIRYFGGRPGVLLADCNGRPGGRVRTLLDGAGFTNVWGDAPTALVVKNGVTEEAPIDLIAVRGIEAVRVGMLPSVRGIPSPACPSDHRIIVADVSIG